jgi:hypothetical protein
MTTTDDMFRFFEANANGMEAFAREAGVAPALPRRETAPKQGLWERLGLTPAPAPVRKPRRRLAQGPLLPSSQTS